MQLLNEPPRDAFTYDEVTSLVRATALTIGFGCRLSDLTLSSVEDISGDVMDGGVSRASYNTIHGSAAFSVARDIPWGYAVLLPYYTMSDGVTTMRFNLGAYFTNTPGRPLENKPVVHQVDCYDVIEGLGNPLGDTYSLLSGTPILSTVEDVLVSQGYSRYIIDQSAADKTLPNARSWVFTEQVTWLHVVNDLLGMVGYQGIWSDWNGWLRCHPYVSPVNRVPEWAYDGAMLLPDRVEEFDYKGAPNSWVFVRSNNIDGAQPVDGNGVYRYDNLRDGPTSQEARRRTIVKKVMVEAADHASLVASAQRTIDADMHIPIKIVTDTFPNPLHWHFDVMSLDDPDRGRPVRVLGTQWTLPMDGSNMSHQWTVIDP